MIGRLERVSRRIVCLLEAGKSVDKNDHTFHLFVREKNAQAEQWDGVRSGTRAAVDVFNADEVWKESNGDKNLD